MGKADIRDPDEVASEHAGVSYRAFDLGDAGAERIHEMLVEVVELFERGVLNHPPISTWDVRRGMGAFRFLRESRHVGKIVLRVPQPPDPHGTILITGGTGGLGALLARHLVEEHGARHLLLVSRSGLKTRGAKKLKASLKELGCDAQIAACDVTDRMALSELIDSVATEHPLTAVIHAAGVLDDGVIESLDGERLRQVMAPKVDGAINLHELTKHLELSEFVLFSSAAATVGNPGQANYAAANAFLDALAHHRRALGLPSSSMAWGAWAMATAMTGELTEADLARLKRGGMVQLSDKEGLELFDLALDAGEALMLQASLDLRALRVQARSGVLPALLSGLVGVPARRSNEQGATLARRLVQMPEAAREGVVIEIVRDQVASVLGHASPEAIDTQRTFKDLGFDSLTAVELRNRLNATTGRRLPATLVFDYPTTAAVASYLLGELSGKQLNALTPSVSIMTVDGPLAIIGMSCRYPGGMDSPDISGS